MATKCKLRKNNGERCGADAQLGKMICVFHDPDRATDGEEARRAGGLTRARRNAVLSPETPDFELRTTQHVAGLLAESINHLRRGKLDPRVGNSVGYLSGILLRALEQGSIGERLMKLEDALGLHYITSSDE